MSTDASKLDFTKPLIYLGVFALVIALLFLVFSKLSDQRREATYQAYAEETEIYVQKNRDGLQKIFTEIFPSEPCTRLERDLCPQPNGDEIAKLISQDLKDWSSMFFIKLVNGQIMYMRLAGQYERLYIHPKEKEDQIIKLLSGEIIKIPWDNYTYELAQKEVILPVRDGNNKIIGALVRGVIE